MRISKTSKVWVRLPEELDPEQTGKVLVRSFKPGDVTKVNDAARFIERRFETGKDGKQKPVTVERFSELDRAHKFCELRIVGWDGFFDEDLEDGTKGPPLTCSRENKQRFAEEPDFYLWLITVCNLIDKENKGELDEAEKNLLDSVRLLPEKAESPKTAKSAVKRGAGS